MTRKIYTRAVAFCAAVCLWLGYTDVAPVFADGSQNRPGSTVLSCTYIPLYMEEGYIGSGILMGAVTYVPIRTFAEHILQETFQVSWDQESSTAILTTDRLTITITLGQRYMTANGRLIYLGDAVYNINGTIVVPIRELCRLLGLSLEWDTDDWTIHIDASQYSVPEYGETYYDPEDLYWLSRVICSEAANQPLEGMIGVGNVVLNRLYYPTGEFGNSIYEVIFQPGQFDVVSSGMIYCEPSESAIAAAKLCLEGYSTVGNSLWFVNPYIGISTWMQIYKTYYCSIADHDFYA